MPTKTTRTTKLPPDFRLATRDLATGRLVPFDVALREPRTSAAATKLLRVRYSAPAKAKRGAK